MGGRLADADIEAGLAELPGWERDGDAIRKRYEFPTYLDGVRFVARLADLAEAVDHHPDLTLGYKRVDVVLTSHDVNGVSARDLRFARRVDGV